MAISILYNPFPMRLFEADGDFASGAKAYFYLARTTTPFSVYTDSPLAVPHTWPVIADAYGLLPPIYLATGTEYKVRIEDTLGSLLYAADGISNPVLTDAGSGGGTSGGASQLFQTGYFDWQPVLGERVGWVRANGNTISSATGTGGTANDDCEALFAFLWNTFSQHTLPGAAIRARRQRGGRLERGEVDCDARHARAIGGRARRHGRVSRRSTAKSTRRARRFPATFCCKAFPAARSCSAFARACRPSAPAFRRVPGSRK